MTKLTWPQKICIWKAPRYLADFPSRLFSLLVSRRGEGAAPTTSPEQFAVGAQPSQSERIGVGLAVDQQ